MNDRANDRVNDRAAHAPPHARRHVGLLLESAAAGLADEANRAAAVLAARALGLPCPGHAALPEDPADAADGGGHRRPHYAGLMAYALARAGDPPARWLDALDRRSGPAAWPDKPMPGGRDAEALRLAFDHLALAAAGRREDAAAATFARLARQRCLLTDDGSNPEPRWYAELALLHALASYAALTADAALLSAAADGAAHHQAETQPDHATGQPWAVHAALLRPDTLPLADLLLLPAAMRPVPDAVTRLLLADAALCLTSLPADTLPT